MARIWLHINTWFLEKDKLRITLPRVHCVLIRKCCTQDGCVSLQSAMSLSLTGTHIVFDECHKAKNLVPTGSSKPSKTGLTVLQLQKKLPKARIVYCSATGRSTAPPESNTKSAA